MLAICASRYCSSSEENHSLPFIMLLNQRLNQSFAMQPATPYVNIAAYKFITFDDTAARRPEFRTLCEELNLKGTILLSPEGINLFLAGLRTSIDCFLAWLRTDPRFTDLEVKESYSEKQPFTKMLVKLKPEIITMKMPLIQPEKG